MEAFGGQNLMLVSAFVVSLAFASWVASRLLRLSKEDSTAIEMEVIVRNVNLGLLIKASMFPATLDSATTIGDMVLFTLLLYGALQMLVAAVLIFMRRRGSKVTSIET